MVLGPPIWEKLSTPTKLAVVVLIVFDRPSREKLPLSSNASNGVSSVPTMLARVGK